MNNKNQYDKIYNLNHKSDYYLMNNYEDNIEHNEWKNDNIITYEDSVPINDDYSNESSMNKRYSFRENKGFKFK